jgi:hypothetical protein
MRRGSEWYGQRVVDKEVIEEIRKGGDREKFKASGMTLRPGYSYHNQWWILHNADGAYEASGIHGNMIHINSAAEMVVIKLSSHAVAGANHKHRHLTFMEHITLTYSIISLIVPNRKNGFS